MIKKWKPLFFATASLVLVVFFIQLFSSKESFAPFYTFFYYFLGVATSVAIGFIAFLLGTQKSRKQETKEAIAKSNHAIASQSLFLANMSHEIRTPMNGITGLTHLLIEEEVDEKKLKMLESIRLSGDSLLRIINDILDFTKIEAGQLAIEAIYFDLNRLIEDVLQAFSEQAQSKRLYLKYEKTTEINPIILSDPTRVRQILINLVGNAIKFTHVGGVTLLVEMTPEKRGTINLNFSIKDTGIGISKDNQKRLFQKFSQADSSTTRKYGGTGLGLSIAKKLSNLLNGDIKVDSLVGKGTTFTFALSVKTGSESDVQEVTRASGIKNMANEFPLNILVVEDNKINRQLAEALFSKLGYQIDTAEDGMEAIESIKYKKFDLIFMDMQMPRMDGVTATKQILQKNAEEAPKIVAMTANAFAEDRNKCLAAGMVDFLTKPINFNEISAVITKIHGGKFQQSTTINPEPLPQKKAAQTICQNSLMENFGDDLDTLDLVFQNFLQEKEELVDALSICCLSDDYEGIQKAAHKMKGMASNFYAEILTQKLLEIETIGREAKGTVNKADLDALVIEITNFERAMSSFIRHKKAS